MVNSSDPFNRTAGPPIGPALIVGIISVLSALVVGGVLFFSSSYTYLIFFSVMIAAFVVGGAIVLGLRFTKLRSVRLVIFLAMLGGLLMYGTYRYLEYADFVSFAREDLYLDDPRMDDTRADKFINSFFKEETGYDGILGFWLWQAQEGMEITSTSRYSRTTSSSTLSKELTIGYWVLEILIAIGIPTGLAVSRAKQPFCEETGKWLEFETVKGRIPYKSMEFFDEAVARRDFNTIGSLLEDSRMWRASLQIQIGRCTEQSPDGILRVTRLEGRNTRVVYEDILTRDEFSNLLASAPQ